MPPFNDIPRDEGEQLSSEPIWPPELVNPSVELEQGLEAITFTSEESYRSELHRLQQENEIHEVRANPDGTITVTFRRRTPTLSTTTAANILPTSLRGYIQAFNSRQAFSGFDVWSPPSPSSNKPPLDKETQTRLMRAVAMLEQAHSDRTKHMTQMRGKREGQYIKMLRSDKQRNMTFIEIVGSEVPVRMASYGWSKMRQILDTIRMSEVEIKEGNYAMHCANKKCTLKEVPFDFAYFCHNHLYCAEHVPDLKLCDRCLDLYPKTKPVTTYDGKTLNICHGCASSFLESGCRRCRADTTLAYISAGVCARCVDHNPTTSPYHVFSKSLKWTSAEKGTTVLSSRVYSAEIEALSPSIDHPSILYKSLPPEVGIATDGSVTANDGRAYGFELQTPRLSGKRGEELVQRMCAAVRSVEAQVNESCGMHVHIDGKGLIPLDRKEYPAALVQLWKAYLVFEDVLMSLVPYSRRNNDFCRRLSEAFQINELDTIENMVEVEKMWYKARTTADIRSAKGQHYSTTRYFGVNFHCLLNDGHFEIRFRHGTTNPTKILEWANLHTLMADAAVRLAFSADFLREAQATYHLKEKAQMLYSRLGMSKSSIDYFLSQQRKFADKKNRDEETKNNGNNHRGNTLTIDNN